MIKNYFKVIFRNFTRHKLYSITNLLGLSVAMMGFIIVSLYVKYELSYDKFHEDVEEIYMLKMKYPENRGGFYNQFMPPVFGKAIEEEIPGVSAVTITGTGVGTLDVFDSLGNVIEEPFYQFEPSFFDIFSFPAKYGDPQETLEDPTSLIISNEIAVKYFNQENAVGKTFRLKEFGVFKVGAVLDEFPANSQFQPHFILPLKATVSTERMNNWGSNTHFVYMKIPSSVDKKQVEESLVTLYTKNSPEGLYAEGEADLFPFQNSYWEWSMSGASLNNRTQSLGADKTVMIICSSLAIILLIIALTNYVNMATARAIKRAKEVGVRKVNGASPKQLIFQFLSESITFSFICLIVSLIGVELILPSISQVLGMELKVDLLSMEQILLLTGYALFCGLAAGLYPALFMARFKPTKVLKSKVSAGGTKASLSKVLLGVQFTLASLLITCILILNSQLIHYLNFDLGFEKDQVVSINLPDELRGNADALMNDLRSQSGVSGVTLGPLPASADGFNDISFGETNLRSVTRIQTDENFIPVMGIQLLEGRNFDPSKPSDFENGILINNQLAEKLGLDKPAGAIVSLAGMNKTVLGVIADIQTGGARIRTRDLIIYPRTDQAYRLLVKVNSLESMEQVESVYSEYASGSPLNYRWLDDAYAETLYRISRVTKIINGATVLTVFISIIGLFAMLAFSISNRLKEIGVRKILGARYVQLQWSIAKPFALISVISLLIAIPLAYYLMGQMFQNYYNRIEFTAFYGLAALVITVCLNFLVITLRGLTISKMNPVDILQDE